MNILLLAAEFPPKIGGLANYTYNIVKYLNQNNRVMVARALASSATVKRYVLNIQWIYIMERRINELKKNKEIDIIYAIAFRPQFSLMLLITKILGSPLISHGVGLDIYTLDPRLVLARKIAYLVSDKLICGTQFQKGIMAKEGAPIDKINAVLGGVNTKRFRPLTDYERYKLRRSLNIEDKFVLLSLGRLIKRKGFDDAIKTLTYLSEINDITLLIVGDGPEKRFLVKLTESLSLENKVKFLGTLPSSYIPKIYNVADLFIAPFKTLGREIEGFPLVVQEAQACGIPVISTRHTGVPELVENNKTGFLVAERTPTEMAEKIMILYNDLKLRNGMSKAARKRAEEILSYNMLVKKIEKIFQEVVN